jgi:1-acyl-sn-glycerol-3-phosphate acyltransferase
MLLANFFLEEAKFLSFINLFTFAENKTKYKIAEKRSKLPPKYMKIVKILFGFYAFIVFCISLLIVFPVYLLILLFFNKSSAPVLAHKLSRKWAAFLLACFCIRYRIKNKAFIDSQKTYVFIGNHRSTLDIPLYALSCQNTFRFLSKAELTKIPLLGFVIKKLYITVQRENKNDRHRSIEVMKKTLDENISVFLCPEGTRNTTDEMLLPFKEGAFRLAIATQRPLAVLTIVDSDKFLAPDSPLALMPGTIHMQWSVPIETCGMTEKDVPHLKEMAMQQMLEILIHNK